MNCGRWINPLIALNELWYAIYFASFFDEWEIIVAISHSRNFQNELEIPKSANEIKSN